MQNLQFDFFNYAGIHRSVSLYTRPEVYISDMVTNTTQVPSSSLWYLNYHVSVNGSATASATVMVKLFDSNGSTVVASGEGASGILKVSNPMLWWPWSMNLTQSYSYMYRLQVGGGA